MTARKSLLTASLPMVRLRAIRWRLVSVQRETLLSLSLLAFAVGFNLYFLLPEVAIAVPRLNDGVLHALLLKHTVGALEAHQNPTDFWFAPVGLGYPLFHYYQHLPYLPPALVSVATRGAISPSAALSWTTYLLLSIFPLVIYWSMRRFGFGRLPAACAGLVAPLLSTNGLYGLDFVSYVWRGFGLYTQAWAMILLPLTLSQGYRALKDGRGYVWAVLLLAATLMSHLVYGYTALISLAVLAFVVPQGRELVARGRRLALVFGGAALAISYFLVPFLLDNAYLNRSVWEGHEKYDSFGFQLTMHRLFDGDLFDYGRFPSLTLLAALGLLVCLWRWRSERFRIPVALGVVWLLLYFGRATWGRLFTLLPLSHDLHLHRFIGGVHLAGIFLMGLGLAALWRWALSRRDPRWLLAPLVVTGLLLYPVYQERADYLQVNTQLMEYSRDAYAADSTDLTALVGALRKLPPGRVYAGLGNNWGNDYKVGAVPMYGILNSADLDSYGYLYHALSLNAEVQVLFDDTRQDEYNLYNIRYVVAPAGHSVPAFAKLLGSFGRHRLYQVDTTGYFDLVGVNEAFAGGKAQLYPASSAWLHTSLPRLKEEPAVFLDGRDGDVWPTQPLSSAPAAMPRLALTFAEARNAPRGRVFYETVDGTTYRAGVDVTRDSYLLFKVTYHPNWHAYIDGREVQTVMLMPSFVGVRLAPGVHTVRLEYRPQAMRTWLMVLGALTLIGLAMVELRPRMLDGIAQGPMATLRERVLSTKARLVPPVERRSRLFAGFALGPVDAARERLLSLKTRLAPAVEGRAAAFEEWLAGVGWAGVRDRALTTFARLGPHAPYLIGLGALTVAAGFPLFHLKLMSGHDTFSYPPRYVEFYEALKDGQLVPRWAQDLAFGHGEPTFNFNPPLLYYLVAGIHTIGFDFIQSEDLVLFALLALSGLGMYLLANEVFGRRGAMVAATAYLFAPYMLVCLYVRHVLADYTAFAPIPFAFWGLFAGMTRKSTPLLLIGAVAIAALMLSSISVALITFPALVALVAAVAWKERSVQAALRGAWCIGLGLGLSAFFWIPAMRETGFVHISRREAGGLNYHNHFVYIQQLIYSKWGYGLSVPGSGDGLSFGLGPAHLILTAAALVLLRPIWRASARAGVLVASFLLLLLASVFFMTGASLFIWERVVALHPVQFPWRILSFAAPATALLCGAPFLLLRSDTAERRRLANVLMLVAIAAIVLWGFRYAHPQRFLDTTDAQFSPANIASQGIAATAREFEPIDVEQFPSGVAAEPISVLSGSAAVTVIGASVTERQFFVRVDQDAQLRMNTFYFSGWTLYVDAERQPVRHYNPQGLMDFSLRRGAHTVSFEFRDTPVRTWSDRLSLLSLAALVVAAAGSFAAALRRMGRVSAVPDNAPMTQLSATLQAIGGPPAWRWPAWRVSIAGIRSSAAKGQWRALAVVLGAAALTRVALMPLYAYLPGNSLDEFAWKRWMEASHVHGVLNIFRVTGTDYVGYHWVLWLLSVVHGWIGGTYVEHPVSGGQWQALDPTVHYLLKAPPLLFDAALVFAVYAATSVVLRNRVAAVDKPAPRATGRFPLAVPLTGAAAAAAIIAWQPAVIYESSVWAQIDAAITAAMLGSIVLIALGYPVWGWCVWAAGFLVKTHPVIILPLLVVLTVQKFGWKRLALAVVAAACVIIAIIGPWILHGDFGRVVDVYRTQFRGDFYSDRLSSGAWNLWWFWDVASHPRPGDAFLSLTALLTYQRLGLMLSGGAALLSLAYVWRRPRLEGALVAAAYMAFAFYMLPTSTHERYLYPFLGLLLPAVIANRRWLWLYVPVSATFLLNLAVIAPPIHAYSGRWDDSPFSLAIAAVNIVLFAAMTLALVRGVDWRDLAGSAKRLPELLPPRWLRLLQHLPARVGWRTAITTPTAPPALPAVTEAETGRRRSAIAIMGALRERPSAYVLAVGAVLLIAFALRVYDLSGNPPELFEDELNGAASVWSLVTTGHDVEHTRLPFVVTRLGYNEPLYFVPTVFTQAVFGHTAFAVRLPAVGFGVLTAGLVMWLMVVMGRSRAEAVLGGAIFAVVPWAVHNGRVGYEPASLLPFTLAGAGLLWIGFERSRPRMTAAGVIVLALGAYTYHPALTFNLLLGATVLALHWRSVRGRTLAALVIGGAIATVILLPYVTAVIYDPIFTARARDISIFAHRSKVDAIGLGWRNYWEQWNPQWLFLSQAHHLRYHPNTPLLFAALAPGLVAGLIRLARRRATSDYFLLTFLALGALPAGLTNDTVPNFGRGLFALPPLVIIIAIGLAWLWELARGLSRPLALACAATLVALTAVQAGFAYHAYYVNYPAESATSWYYGSAAAFRLADRSVPAGGRLCIDIDSAYPATRYTGRRYLHLAFPQYVFWYLHPERYTVIEGASAPLCRQPGTYILDDVNAPNPRSGPVVGVVPDFTGKPLLRLRIVPYQTQ